MISGTSTTSISHPKKHLAPGYSLIELMVSIAIGLVIVATLIALFISTSRTNSEMAKANSQIENGRFAIQLLEQDIAHAGFWNGHVPQYDNLSVATPPTDAPTAVPEIYASYNTTNWTPAHINNLVDIPLQAYSAAPGCTNPGGGCTSEVVTSKRDNSDVLVVRHAAPCALTWASSAWAVPTGANCEAETSGKLYFQSSLCSAAVEETRGQVRAATATLISLSTGETNNLANMLITITGGTGIGQSRVVSAYDTANQVATVSTPWTTNPDSTSTYAIAPLTQGTAQAGAAGSITLAAGSSNTPNFYRNMVVTTTGGTGAGQTRVITGYNGTTKIATVSSDWTTTPNNTTQYTTTPYLLGTTGFGLQQRDCSTLIDKRKFNSHIYYIKNISQDGQTIPTLMRAEFDLASGTLAHQTAQPLIENIEGFRAELGIDNLSDSGAAVALDAPVQWADTTNLTSPTNRGDGIADVICGTTTNCVATSSTNPLHGITLSSLATDVRARALANVVTARIHVLARSKEPSPGYVDAKTYALGSTTLGPFNDGYKRHVFSATVRLNNVSGRRETP